MVDAYRRSGLGVDAIDIFETHDCFTSSEYMAISAFGITEPGEEYEAVEYGRIAFECDKPINPSGGFPKNGIMLNIGGTATTNYVFVVGNKKT